MNPFELIFSVVASLAIFVMTKTVMKSDHYNMGEKGMMLVVVVFLIGCIYFALRGSRSRN